MAKSTELINTIAEAVAVVPPATVLLHDRALMEAGVRTKTKRGRGAADMTARDAANLLISVLASPIAGPNVKGSVERWRQYATLVCDSGFQRAAGKPRKIGSKWELPGYAIQNLTALQSDHTAADAIEAIVKSVADRSLYRAFELDDEKDWLLSERVFRIELSFPVPLVKIQFSNLIQINPLIDADKSFLETHAYFFAGSAEAQAQESFRRFEAGDMSWSGDLRETRTITLKTLIYLGKMLRDQSEADD